MFNLLWINAANLCFNSCSGMPECKLGLNDRVLLEAQGRTAKGKAIDLDDIKFHQYVASFHFFFPPFASRIFALFFHFYGMLICF